MEYLFSDRFNGLESNAIRAIFKLLSRPEIISFAGGIPASSCLPLDKIKSIAAELLSGEAGAKLLQYGATEGYTPLLESGLAYLKRKGIEGETKENILVVSGGQQGIDLMFKAFVNQGDTVLFENPTYLAALHILKTYEGKAVGVDSHRDGLNLEDLERKIILHRPKLLYLVPTFSNPTGKTLSMEKRKRLLEILKTYDLVMIEDDPYGELRYSGEPLPAVRSMDGGGNVVFITSFSKTVSPGLRVGLVSADPRIIQKLTLGKQAADVHTSMLSQAIVDSYLRKGYFLPQLQESIPVYREKRDAMLTALDRYFPSGVTYTRPEGGLFIFAELPRHIETDKLFLDAVAANVAFVAGGAFYAENAPKNTMRLNFSNSSKEEIDRGIDILGKLIKDRI